MRNEALKLVTGQLSPRSTKARLKVVEKKPAKKPESKEESWLGHEVLDLMRECQSAFETKKGCAEMLGISPSYWGQLLNHGRLPGPKVLKGLEIKRTWYYEKE